MKWPIFIAIFLFSVHVGEARRRPTHPKVDPDCECGISGEEISNRIVGGRIAIPHIFPWVVAIFHRNQLHCGGALINNRYVLTAGHCIKWITNHKNIEVGLGMHDISDRKSGYIVPIDRGILHENFESDFLHDTNDIALLKLKHPVKYSQNVQPLCLPARGSNHSGHEVKVAGWGRVKTDGEASTRLRQATLRVMSSKQCLNTSFAEHITDAMLCAYSDGKDACQGDSGGPLLFEREDGKYETIGIVSWGIGCANPGMPGIYTKLTRYLNWVKRNTRDAVYCMNH